MWVPYLQARFTVLYAVHCLQSNMTYNLNQTRARVLYVIYRFCMLMCKYFSVEILS